MESRKHDHDNRIPHRTIRIEDELWEAVREAAKWREESSVSHVVRRCLTAYVRATDKKRREAEAG